VKVLVVVEDNSDMVALIEVNLATEPRLELVGRATTALEAIELAREEQPSLIILDHFIDGETMGLQAAPLLKAVAPTAKILLFTSHPLEVEAAREPTVDAFLRKAKINELLPMVSRLLDLAPTIGEA
jgi:DNA-binding NarL/FixJ family response regulator